LSNALYPLNVVPPYLAIVQYISKGNPMTYIIDAVRDLMITGNLTSLPMDLVVIVVFIVVMYILAAVSFKRIIE
jgi:ABC-type polysaccharide/polyol phosphate export permease